MKEVHFEVLNETCILNWCGLPQISSHSENVYDVERTERILSVTGRNETQKDRQNGGASQRHSLRNSSTRGTFY